MPKQTIVPPKTATSISEVSDISGIMKETLRVWERRYGFPNPCRSASGERKFTGEQVQRLRLIKGLLSLGYRPGAVVGLGMDELTRLNSTAIANQAPQELDPHGVLQQCVDLLKAHEGKKLRSILRGELLCKGLGDFVNNVAIPLTRWVGAGRKLVRFTAVAQHLLDEIVEPILRDAIVLAEKNNRLSDGPKILLTAGPHDRSLLELLCVTALFTLEGADCSLLGFNSTSKTIVERARVDDIDFVVMCCSYRTSSRAVVENTRRMQADLSAKFLVSIDPNCGTAARRLLGPDPMLDLLRVGETVTKWRRSLCNG